MIAERLPLFNGRLKSDVANCSTEPSTVTATDLFLAGAVLDGGATGGYAFFPELIKFNNFKDILGIIISIKNKPCFR